MKPTKQMSEVNVKEMSLFSKWILCWIMVFQGIIRILSLGLGNPQWIINYCRWDAKRRWKKEHGTFEDFLKSKNQQNTSKENGK